VTELACAAVIVLGGFFVVNLFLALIFDEYLTATLLAKIEKEADQFRQGGKKFLEERKQHIHDDSPSQRARAEEQMNLLDSGAERSDLGWSDQIRAADGVSADDPRITIPGRMTTKGEAPSELAKFVTSPKFNTAVRGIVLLNILLM
jgi:hypothetical protein